MSVGPTENSFTLGIPVGEPTCNKNGLGRPSTFNSGAGKNPFRVKSRKSLEGIVYSRRKVMFVKAG